MFPECMNIENLYTMTQAKKTTQGALVSLITISLLICSGCNPTAKKEVAEKDTASSNNAKLESNSDPVTTVSPEKGDESVADKKPATISGDLALVDWQSLVGEEVTVAGELVVVDTYDLVRRGQVKVARDRLFIPTSQIDPNDADASATSFEGGSNVAQVAKAQKFNDEATIILDDGSADENIFPPKLFPNLGDSQSTVRVGSLVNGVSGKLVKAGRNLLLVPNEPLQWTPAQRPQRPDVGEADVTVASFNVLNYFTTIDDGANNARGADSGSEFKRQEAKLVSTIIALQADVIGLMELENNLESELRLVAALNREVGEDVFQGCGLPEGFGDSPGGQNAIRVGVIYRSDRVAPVGKVSMINNIAFSEARTPIVQSFKPLTQNDAFTVIVNHFKSKGGSDRADVANKNKGDGQGAYNAMRRSQSLAICEYIDKLNNANAESRVLVIGDLNSYGQEDPIDAMRAKGLVDLRERFADESLSNGESRHYSYIYYGQCGNLDHAMATNALADDVTGVATWHINADEPRFLDYNEEYNPELLYKANPFRSSDHDPVLIGIQN